MNPSRPSVHRHHRRVSVRHRAADSDSATSTAADAAIRDFVDRRRRRNRGDVATLSPASALSGAIGGMSAIITDSVAQFGVPQWLFRALVLGTAVAGLCYAILTFRPSGPPLPLHPVSARVLVGRTVPVGARVILHPRSETLPNEAMPQGTVQADGSVTFVTYPPLEGVPAGDYVATVQWFKVAADGSVGGNAVPPRYASPALSPLTLTVAADASAAPLLHITAK